MRVDGTRCKPTFNIFCPFKIKGKKSIICFGDNSIFNCCYGIVARHKSTCDVLHISHRLSSEVAVLDSFGSGFEFLELFLNLLSPFNRGTNFVKLIILDVSAFDFAVLNPLKIKAFFAVYYFS